MRVDLDLLLDGTPLLVEWMLLEHSAELHRLGLWPALDAICRGVACPGLDRPGAAAHESLLTHVMGALCDRRPESFRRLMDSQAAGAELIPPPLATCLRQWLDWSTLPLGEAFAALNGRLPTTEDAGLLHAFTRSWRLLEDGRLADAATGFRECRRQARDLGRRRLADVAGMVLAKVETRAAVDGRRVTEGAGPAMRGARHPGGGSDREQSERLRLREACYLACHRYGRMIGAAPAFLEHVRRLKQAAGDSLPLLLVGQTGTGKELAVDYLHQLSCRDVQPLVAVNCGGLSETLAEAELFGSVRGAFTGAVEREGLVAQAEGGLLFLDEFGSMPPSVQARLLRFLESGVFRRVGEARERRVSLRVAAATCEGERLGEGFRQDLLHRVAGHVIEVPPLPRRLEDLPLLVRSFLHEAGVPDPARHPASATTALAKLRQAPWPGNIRQLRHLVLRLAHLSPADVRQELERLADPAQDAGCVHGQVSNPASPSITTMPLREAVARFEWSQIQAALSDAGQDKRLAARRLGISLPTLYARLKGGALRSSG